MTCRVLDRRGHLIAGNLYIERALSLASRVARAHRVVDENGVILSEKKPLRPAAVAAFLRDAAAGGGNPDRGLGVAWVRGVA